MDTEPMRRGRFWYLNFGQRWPESLPEFGKSQQVALSLFTYVVMVVLD